MKKGLWKKIVVRVLTVVMLASVFSTVDMGWNVIEVQAAQSFTSDDFLQVSGQGTCTKGVIQIQGYFRKYTDTIGAVQLGSVGFYGNTLKVSLPSEDYHITKVEIYGSVQNDVDDMTVPWFDTNRGTIIGSEIKNTSKNNPYYNKYTINNVNYSEVTLSGNSKYKFVQTFKNIDVTYEVHTSSGATCIKQATCTKCGKVSGGYGNHALSSKNGQAATCTADGWNSYWQCSTCNKISASNSQAGVTYDTLDVWKISAAGKIGKLGHDFR